MSDPTPPEAIEPDRQGGQDDGRGTQRQPAPAAGTPPARVGGDSAREQRETLTREQPEQDPSAHGPGSRTAGGADGTDPGAGGLNRVPPEDAPRLVPERGGVDEGDMREQDLATHPDQLEDNPDGAGDRPRPL